MGRAAMGILLPLLLVSLAPHRVTYPAEASTQNEQLDEVVVRGKRVQLAELRRELVALEDRFYLRYNELNTNDDFDIHCIVEARTGTRFEKRSCRASYQEEALREEAKAALATRQDVQNQLRANAPNPTVTGHIPVPATVVIEARLPEFRRNVREVAARDAGLGKLLKDRADLVERYEHLRREVFDLDPYPEEEAEVPEPAKP